MSIDETRALLDALMGPNRNKKGEDKKGEASGEPEFADRSVCKDHLVGFCCRDWFSLPKRQLDPCKKVHSDFMKTQFESHSDMKMYRAWWEEDFLAYLERAALDCDQFIMRERAKCRPKGTGPRLPGDVKEKIEELQKRYDALIAMAEELADKDQMTQSREHMTQAVPLKEQIDDMRTRHTAEFAGEDLCEVCGVKYPLGTGGAEWHDKESHMKGKTHQGYAEIRSKIAELKGRRKGWEKYADERRKRQKAQEKEEEKRREEEKKKAREREKEKERERKKEEEQRKEREKEREKERAKQKAKEEEEAKKKERDRSRDRSRKKDRERSRGRKGSRDRSKKKDRSRSRSGRRDRSGGDAKAQDRGKDRAGSEGSEDGSSGEESEGGVSVAEEDIPALWEKLQSLSAEPRGDTLAALTAPTTARLETWLVNKVTKKKGKSA